MKKLLLLTTCLLSGLVAADPILPSDPKPKKLVTPVIDPMIAVSKALPDMTIPVVAIIVGYMNPESFDFSDS